MKRVVHILCAVLLSVTMIAIGSGVDIVRCSHSGHVTVMTMSAVGDDAATAGSCAGGSHCMDARHLQLSPCGVTQALILPMVHVIVTAIIAPSVATIGEFVVTERLPLSVVRCVDPPPRLFLNLLCTLII